MTIQMNPGSALYEHRRASDAEGAPLYPVQKPNSERAEQVGRNGGRAGMAPGGPQVAVLIDRRHLTRECLAAWLTERSPDIRVQTHSCVSEAVEAGLDGEAGRMVILLSVGTDLPSTPEVVEAIADLEEAAPRLPVLLIGDRSDSGTVIEALGLGLRGYLPTTTGPGVLVGAIQLVLAGGTYVPESALVNTAPSGRPAADLPDRGLIEGFTPRQSQVLACLRQGKPNKTIAYELNMCESTVKVHIRHIMKKLRATNRTQVVFFTNGLFPDGAERN